MKVSKSCCWEYSQFMMYWLKTEKNINTSTVPEGLWRPWGGFWECLRSEHNFMHIYSYVTERHKDANHNATLSWGWRQEYLQNHQQWVWEPRSPEPSLASIYWRNIEILRGSFFFNRSSIWWSSKKTQSLTSSLFYLFFTWNCII